jgi:large subunit ribosomal protein L24
MQRIKVNDNVIVISGKEKGKTGKVLNISSDRVVIEGVNMIKKHVKPNAANENGGIVEMEASVHASNVMLIDPKTKKGTRVGIEVDKNGKKIRVSKKSNEKLD